jgi:hypothetical protein
MTYRNTRLVSCVLDDLEMNYRNTRLDDWRYLILLPPSILNARHSHSCKITVADLHKARVMHGTLSSLYSMVYII